MARLPRLTVPTDGRYRFTLRYRLVHGQFAFGARPADAVPADSGEIVLTTAYRPGVKIATPVAGNEKKERLSLPLEVTVRDNGHGIPADLLPNIFDPFVTTKSHGAGLGLALVAKIIADHGGVIECESQPRRTVFRVLLPVAPQNQTGPGHA